MNRRAFLSTVKAGVVVGLTASTAGCSANTGSSDDEESDPTEQEFQYYFMDETGTLGDVVAGNEPPGDAAEWQILRNTLTEADWQEKQDNDVQAARDYLAGELDRLPQHSGHEGTVDQIVERTREIYEIPEEALDTGKSGDELLLERLQEDSDPERFTRALIHATQTETDILSSAGSNNIVPSIGEYAMAELGLEFPEYELSTLGASEPVNGASQGVIEESIREREDGSKVGITGMNHLLSFLIYQDEGELQTRYVENVGAVRPNEFEKTIRRPEESEYRTPIDEGSFEVRGKKEWPEHYVTGFEPQKRERMKQMGVLEEGPSDSAMIPLEPIDDGLNDRITLPNNGYDIELSDQIKSGISDFAVNPSMGTKQALKYLRRALYLVMQKQIGEDYKGEPVYGAEGLVRVEGTVQDPAFYHEPRPGQNQ